MTTEVTAAAASLGDGAGGAGGAPQGGAAAAQESSPPQAIRHLLRELGRQWGWIAVRGAAALLFGVLALVLPEATLAALVILWGAYALVDGVFAIVGGLRIRDEARPLWPLVVAGLLGVAAGVVALLWPGITALTLVILIGAWSVAIGVLQIATAIRLRKEIEGEWLYGLSGLVSVLFGAFVLIWPGAGALALLWLIASYAIVFGVLLLSLAWRLRRRIARHAGE